MKTYKSIKLFIVYCFLTFTSTSQLISPSTFNSIGTSFQNPYSGMDMNIGEPITGLISNSSNQITQGFLQPEDVTLDLKVFIQGYYIPYVHKMRALLYTLHVSDDSTACDSINIVLHDPVQPEIAIDSIKAVLHTDGKAEFFFPYPLFNHSYYIVIRHRNSVETWSKVPVLFDARLINYDFSR